MRDVSNIIVPRWILYKESIYRVFVSVLSSAPRYLFPAAIVLAICIYAVRKIRSFAQYSCVAI